MGWLMGPIYFTISWILLRWHELFALILPDRMFLGTNWDWVLAIVFLVITVRVILFPIFVKQIRSQRAMQALQPKMKELQQKHKGDQQALREEMMKLYQQEKVNPLMGCLPLLLQIPVFLGLFHVLRGLNPANPVTRTLYGWTGPAWDSATKARLFGAPLPAHFASDHNELLTLGTTAANVKIVAGILVVIMMITTFLTSRQMILKTGWSQDPQQRMIQKLMLYGIPFSLLISGWAFPIGVIIYWVTQNGFSFGQQYWVLHKYPPPVTAGNIPMKKERPATASAPTGLLARLRPTPKGAPARSGGGFLNPVQPAKGGLFKRKVEDAPQPEAQPKSLAPRPGAKPVRQKPAGAPSAPAEASAPADTPEDAVSGAADSKPAGNGSKPASGEAPTIGRMPTVGAVPGKAAGAKSTANGAKTTDPNRSNGSQPNVAKPADTPANSGAKPAGASKSTGAAKSAGASKSTGAAKSAGASKSTGAAKSTTAKKAAPRKGSAPRKGGPRR
jgi:YidC/Oxa1 family membrane protein insertase